MTENDLFHEICKSVSQLDIFLLQMVYANRRIQLCSGSVKVFSSVGFFFSYLQGMLDGYIRLWLTNHFICNL